VREYKLQSENSKNRKFDKSKPAIVLDMDETLLSAIQDKEEGFFARKSILYMPADLELVQQSKESGKERTTLVTFRPFLMEFLGTLKEKANLFVYTAGTQDYAQPILEFIDPQGEIFSGKLYRHNCVQVGRYFVKDLGIIQ